MVPNRDSWWLISQNLNDRVIWVGRGYHSITFIQLHFIEIVGGSSHEIWIIEKTKWHHDITQHLSKPHFIEIVGGSSHEIWIIEKTKWHHDITQLSLQTSFHRDSWWFITWNLNCRENWVASRHHTTSLQTSFHRDRSPFPSQKSIPIQMRDYHGCLHPIWNWF